MRDPVKYLFIWPAILIVMVITLFPLIYSLNLSFQDIRLVPPIPAKFVGFGNYHKLLMQDRFWDVVGNTSWIVFVSVAIQYILGFGIALALYTGIPGERLFRVSFLLPMLMSPIAVALAWKMVFHSGMGPLNSLFTAVGYPNLPFLTDATWATAVIIIVEIWQWTPFVILLMLAGLQSLPQDIFEAARLENASSWKVFSSITFPMLLPLSVTVIFIRIVEGLKIMDTVYILTGGGPGIATETMTLFAYQEGLKKFNLGYASALSILFLLMVIIFGVIYLSILRPYMERRV